MKRALTLLSITVSLAIAEPISVTKEESGLIRNLKVYKQPSWIAKAETSNGKSAYFSSPKSMFEFYFQPDKYTELGAATPDDITNIIVTDFNTLDAINARSAFYVYGSSQISPAGDDLPAFATKEEAEAFSKKYNGKRIFRFSEVKNSLIRLLNGRI